MDRLCEQDGQHGLTDNQVENRKLTLRLNQAYSAAAQNNLTLALKLLKDECSVRPNLIFFNFRRFLVLS